MPELKQDIAWKRRMERSAEWYARARFGLFYHWGTIAERVTRERNAEEETPWRGGCEFGWKHTGIGNQENARARTVAEFETDTGAPAEVAARMIENVVACGARYLIITLFHGRSSGCTLLYPSRLTGFLNKTRLDYIAALVAECRRKGVRLILYINPLGNPESLRCLAPHCHDRKGYTAETKAIIRELYEQHGDGIAGYWLDGSVTPWSTEISAFIHQLMPHAVAIINNGTNHAAPEMDYGTTEFLSNRPDPAYCRPSGMLRKHPIWGMLPPKRDFNEDVPTCNLWWCTDPAFDDTYAESPYVRDPTYFVREMISSLGQRGRWNYAMGVGPTIKGLIPRPFAPMFANMGRFMGWASEAVCNTTGGEGSALQPGWCNAGAFQSVTVSLDDPAMHYVHVTTAPDAETLQVQCNGFVAESVRDFRTGASVAFTQQGSLIIHCADWDDVRDYGDKIFAVRFCAKTA